MPRISLLGLAFKGVPATDDLRGTMAKPIHAALAKVFPGAKFRGYDPVVPHELARSFFGIEIAQSLSEAFTGSDMAVIMNNHAAFRAMDIGAFAQGMNRPSLIYDFWNMFDDVEDRLPQGCHYMALGSERAPVWT